MTKLNNVGDEFNKLAINDKMEGMKDDASMPLQIASEKPANISWVDWPA